MAMRVLLVNLTRFGDLLQSQGGIMALAGAGKSPDGHAFPGHEVALVCLDNFAPAAVLLQGLTAVFPLLGSHLIKCIQTTGQAGAGWPEGLGALFLWREALWQQFAPDVVVNCTPALSARLLSHFLAKGRVVHGFAVDDNGYGVNHGHWASLLQGAKGMRGASPFNVADVFRAILRDAVDEETGRTGRKNELLPGTLAQPDFNNLESMRKRLESLLPPEAGEGVQGYVALQLGASEKRRQWPVASFAAIGQRCWQTFALCPVLLGAKTEEELALAYGASTDSPFISLCGQTDLPELASALCNCKLLLTNDTGTMHLAAGLGVPVFAIFLATAQPFDTGPCLPGSYSFEPDMDCHPCAFGTACPHDTACRQAISPEAVWPFVARQLAGSSSVVAPEARGARVWRTVCHSGGTLSMESCSGHGSTDRAVWLAAQQDFLLAFLDGHGSVPLGPIALSARGAQEAKADIATVSGYMTILEKQGEVLGVRPLPAMRAKFLQSWSRVTEAISTSRWVAALGPLWVDDTQKEGQDIAQTLAIISQYRKLLGKISEALETPHQCRNE